MKASNVLISANHNKLSAVSLHANVIPVFKMLITYLTLNELTVLYYNKYAIFGQKMYQTLCSYKISYFVLATALCHLAMQ